MGGASPPGYASGGMRTKLVAARIATQAGCAMAIARGQPEGPPSDRPLLGTGRSLLPAEVHALLEGRDEMIHRHDLVLIGGRGHTSASRFCSPWGNRSA